MWEAFKDLIFSIIEFFYNLLGGAAGGDWGMAIIIVTIIFRILMAPIMHRQAKSSYQMQKIQPRIQEIQKRFADDPVRMNDEMQKLYASTKFNPLAGCLPMLLQMPIFIALFQVLQEMASRTQGTSYVFYNIIPDLTMSPSVAITHGFGTFVPYLILMLIFAGATFVPTLLMQRSTGNQSQQKTMLIMMGFMSLFMLWISWSSPAGVLLFWGTSSILAIAQQQISLAITRKKDAEAEEEIEVQPIEVDVTRKVKKPRPTKKR